jgi:hypothetical protein
MYEIAAGFMQVMWFVIELVPGNELKHLFTVEEANAPMLRTMGLYPNLFG